MFERLSAFREQLRSWWADVRADDEAPIAVEEPRVLAFFRPPATSGLPQPVQQAAAAGTLAAAVALGGVALLCFAGLLLALFGIYALVTHVLGLEVDLDPRMWRQAAS